ncbi:histidine phosphatase family protein [Rivularia sp. UHCC 0363]|uniref:histidine phosphatase family protein n=1 Tax=Rivularia sp. UHCC 0363 TaxID=3110244 RepID=UPI002B218C96|nr:histidine phosphatase family protein [Rivularia sp. UHCC 0363]MEA5598759.1 histidine phosphatase family protein [Rivularia sp. UHCC 0363]
MTRVIIVRHGQSTYNTVKRIQGHLDVSELTEKGCSDAVKVGKAINHISFDAIYCSPLKRAKQTAEIIHREIKANFENIPTLEITDKLKEIHLPLWEGMLATEVQEKFSEDYKVWKENPDKLRMLIQNGETTVEYFPLKALYEQATEFWQEILPKHQNQTILVVAHSCINRCLIQAANNISPAYMQRIQQSNCCINVLNFSGNLQEKVYIESFNQTQHMGQALPSLLPNHGVRLLLVRHGETDWNQQSKYQGQVDIPLNQKGQLQSEQVSDFLKDVSINKVFSSGLLRAKETAEIILQHHQHINLELNDGFKEIIHGLWQGKAEAEIEQEFPGALQRWRETPEQFKMPAGETLQQVWQRTVEVYESILDTALTNKLNTVLIVAHGVTNQILLCHILGLSPEYFWNFRQSNCCLNVIDYPKEKNALPVVEAINITSYLNGSVLDETVIGAL